MNDKKTKIIGRTVLAFLAVIVIALLGIYIFLGSGKKKLKDDSVPTMPLEVSGDEDENTDTSENSEYVFYDGKMYTYNKDLINILLIGIDSKEPVPKEDAEYAMGGQNDGNYLLVIDEHSKTIKVLAIDRNTMTEICMYDSDHPDQSIYVERQLALQHGFGGGREKSCELTVEAVSKLLYDLPIQGYMSINYGIIPYINDSVGGVNVTITEEVAGLNKEWTVGEEVTLVNEDVLKYVQYRDTGEFGSAAARLARQKGYIFSLFKTVVDKSKKDITFVPSLYKKVEDYTVTDISLNEMTYLLSEIAGYTFSEDDVYTLPGETIQGIEFEEFYYDSKGLDELMINLFYEPVEKEE